MRRNTHRLASFTGAMLCTFVMLFGINQLAVSSPSSAVLAHATAAARV